MLEGGGRGGGDLNEDVLEGGRGGGCTKPDVLEGGRGGGGSALKLDALDGGLAG